MRCGQCGELAPDGALFCPVCGARVEAVAAALAAPDTSPPNLVGSTIAGRYRLVRQIGEGGMGSVYEAEQALGSSRRAVAVKILRPEWSHEPSVAARFHREAGTVAQLEHFNTVRVYDFGATEDGTLFIVMEYLEGRSLEHVLEEQRALPPARVERIVSQVAASLDEAHGLGIIHRDLKPGNIFLVESYASQRDVVKLVDFGIAQSQPGLEHASLTKLTELGVFVGTPAYMSPEQFSASSIGPRSDIYSLGVTTYQMLTGQLPFSAETALQWAQAHAGTPPPALDTDYGAGPIPESMRQAVLRALSKDPAARQASAGQFFRELSGELVDGAEPTRRAAEAAALSAPVDAPVPPAAVEAAAPGPPKTAPMLKLPEFGAPAAAANGVGPTQPMVDGGAAPERPGPARTRAMDQHVPAWPVHSTPRPKRRLVWASVVLATSGALALLILGLGGRLGPLRTLLNGPSAEPLPVPLIPPEHVELSPDPPALPASTPVVTPPAYTPPTATRLPAPPARPPASTPTTPPVRGPQPAPTLNPGVPPATMPALPPGALPPGALPPGALPPGALPPGVTPPGVTPPGLPAPGSPPAQPTPGTPVQTPVPSMPGLPWSSATAGACERCLEELRGRAHYAVVTAVGQYVLCGDRAGQERCQGQIREVAPTLAEQAAREGDCAAALATMAAAVSVGVPAEPFKPLDALCRR